VSNGLTASRIILAIRTLTLAALHARMGGQRSAPATPASMLSVGSDFKLAPFLARACGGRFAARRTTPVSPERVREVRQLWAVALHYLGTSKELKYEGRTYKDLLAGFRKATVPERDLIVLARSADLDSAAIRLASLDELLNGGMKAVRTRAYPKNVDSPKAVWPAGYMHVFLRDAVAHAEPVDGVDEARFTRRQEWLAEQTLAASWTGVDKARERLQHDIEELCGSAAALDRWMRTDVTRWLGAMKA
jgi:hypothetical protein